MQVIGLPGEIAQGSRLASRLCAAERSEGAHRRDAIERRKQARKDDLNARPAAAVGAPLSTLYRWRKRAQSGRLEPLSRRPRRVRRAQWSPAPVAAVREARNDYPMRGKAEKAANPSNPEKSFSSTHSPSPKPQDDPPSSSSPHTTP